MGDRIVRALPRVEARGLTRAQRHGRRCVGCLKLLRGRGQDFAISTEGSVLKACGKCVPVLYPA